VDEMVGGVDLIHLCMQQAPLKAWPQKKKKVEKNEENSGPALRSLYIQHVGNLELHVQWLLN
jgi:hypothetical protein